MVVMMGGEIVHAEAHGRADWRIRHIIRARWVSDRQRVWEGQA
jgi:hypothetical protein